jgi:NAD(P)-dependent dehydrogenase (short-subunit alcohol dehydrogenase family)
VLVNAICPGWVETQMAVARMTEIGVEAGKAYPEVRKELLAGVPLQRISEPEEVAGLVAFLLSPAAAGFTGQAFDLNNGAWMG